jgi:hypothetical protein
MKRYIFACAACGGLAPSNRRDSITCSGACRVYLHRHPEVLAHLRAIATRFETSVATVLRARAIGLLRPDLSEQVSAGTVTIETAQPAVWTAYWDGLLGRRDEEVA